MSLCLVFIFFLLYIMKNPFAWIEIYVSDMARAKSFYETVFQCKLENMAMPEGSPDGMQMLAFPSNYE